MIRRMKDLDFLFEKEEDIAGYLGVSIDCNQSDGTLTLRQVGITKRIIEALHLDNDSVIKDSFLLM